MAKFLMCSPMHYGIEYSINPWMHPDEWKQDDYGLALEQWSKLRMKLTELGHEVVTIEGVAHLPDMVFAANGGLVLRDIAAYTFFRYEERRKEHLHWDQWFMDHFQWTLVPRVIQEGSGDALFDQYRNYLWTGYGQRSDKGSFKHHKDTFKVIDVVELELIDRTFYHLDTCFCPLRRGEVLWYPEAFSENSQQIVKWAVPEDKLYRLSDGEAYAFAANAINIDDDIIMPSKTLIHREILEDLWGYKVHELDVSAFLKAGGGPACLVLRLDR
jgi:N-dimethylarginine dimethylaminohydrolase